MKTKENGGAIVRADPARLFCVGGSVFAFRRKIRKQVQEILQTLFSVLRIPDADNAAELILNPQFYHIHLFGGIVEVVVGQQDGVR
jgi:hypothetical protein